MKKVRYLEGKIVDGKAQHKFELTDEKGNKEIKCILVPRKK